MSVRFAILYEKGPTSWGASVPDLPGCIAIPDPFHEIGEIEVTAS